MDYDKVICKTLRPIRSVVILFYATATPKYIPLPSKGQTQVRLGFIVKELTGSLLLQRKDLKTPNPTRIIISPLKDHVQLVLRNAPNPLVNPPTLVGKDFFINCFPCGSQGHDLLVEDLKRRKETEGLLQLWCKTLP